MLAINKEIRNESNNEKEIRKKIKNEQMEMLLVPQLLPSHPIALLYIFMMLYTIFFVWKL